METQVLLESYFWKLLFIKTSQTKQLYSWQYTLKNLNLLIQDLINTESLNRF